VNLRVKVLDHPGNGESVFASYRAQCFPFSGTSYVESKFDSRLAFSALERAPQQNAEGTWGGEVSFPGDGEHRVAFCGFHLKRDATLRTTFQTFNIRINFFTFLFPLNSKSTLLNLQYGFQ
jgi:hypothetical protein